MQNFFQFLAHFWTEFVDTLVFTFSRPSWENRLYERTEINKRKFLSSIGARELSLDNPLEAMILNEFPDSQTVTARDDAYPEIFYRAYIDNQGLLDLRCFTLMTHAEYKRLKRNKKYQSEAEDCCTRIKFNGKTYILFSAIVLFK